MTGKPMVEFSNEEYEAAKGQMSWRQIILKALGLSQEELSKTSTSVEWIGGRRE